jgi:hypothetical protein
MTEIKLGFTFDNPGLPISQMEIDDLKEALYRIEEQEPEIKAWHAKKAAIMRRFKELVGGGFEWDGDESFGEGIHWQTPDGTVYVTAHVDGKYVSFMDFDVWRTRKPGETKGDLSMTKARKLGYVVEGK